ncbi:MAG TPA: hypothetical protein VF407_17010 [Polyangiaceae bacterium]
MKTAKTGQAKKVHPRKVAVAGRAQRKRKDSAEPSPRKARDPKVEAMRLQRQIERDAITEERFAELGPKVRLQTPLLVSYADGEPFEVPEYKEDPEFRRLADLADAMQERARRSPTAWQVATANLLVAIVDVLEDEHLPIEKRVLSLKEPHDWAQKVLRGKFAGIPASDHLFRAVKHHAPIVAYDSLVNFLETIVLAYRENDGAHASLGDASDFLEFMMRTKVVGVSSLVDDALEARVERQTRIATGVESGLQEWSKESPAYAAGEIAYQLLVSEMRVSGISEKEIKARMHFLKQREHRNRIP